jgi:hypothetical protein
MKVDRDLTATCLSFICVYVLYFKVEKKTHLYGTIEVEDEPQNGGHLHENDDRVYSCNISQPSVHVIDVFYSCHKTSLSLYSKSSL